MKFAGTLELGNLASLTELIPYLQCGDNNMSQWLRLRSVVQFNNMNDSNIPRTDRAVSFNLLLYPSTC